MDSWILMPKSYHLLLGEGEALLFRDEIVVLMEIDQVFTHLFRKSHLRRANVGWSTTIFHCFTEHAHNGCKEREVISTLNVEAKTRKSIIIRVSQIPTSRRYSIRFNLHTLDVIRTCNTLKSITAHHDVINDIDSKESTCFYKLLGYLNVSLRRLYGT